MPETTEPQLTEAQLIANAVDNSMHICLRNSADQSKPEGFRVMMEHFAEAGRQILEMIQTRRYIDGEPFRCEGCGQPTAMVHFTDDDVGLCRLCFAAVPPANDERCPHCHWKPSPDQRPQSGAYKCGNCNYPFAQRRKDSTLLTEAEVAEIAAAFLHADYDPDTAEMPVCETCDGAIDDHKAGCVVPKIHALIRDWRAMNELVFVPKVLPDDEPLTYRDEAARLLRENTDLREQLAQVAQERDALQKHVADLNHDLDAAVKEMNEHD